MFTDGTNNMLANSIMEVDEVGTYVSGTGKCTSVGYAGASGNQGDAGGTDTIPAKDLGLVAERAGDLFTVVAEQVSDQAAAVTVRVHLDWVDQFG